MVPDVRRTGPAGLHRPRYGDPEGAALPRERLQALLDTVWQRRLGVVVAPAGSGKTTLLASFAASAHVPVAWYRAETWDADEPTILAR